MTPEQMQMMQQMQMRQQMPQMPPMQQMPQAQQMRQMPNQQNMNGGKPKQVPWYDRFGWWTVCLFTIIGVLAILWVLPPIK